MTIVLVPLVLLGPVLLLLVWMIALAQHGPLGWLAAAALLAAAGSGSRWLVRQGWRWWLSTKAPHGQGHARRKLY